MKNRQIDKKITKQIRIDIGLHQLLKIRAARSGIAIKTLLEDYLSDILAIDSKDKIYKIKSKTGLSFRKRYKSITQTEQKSVLENSNSSHSKGGFCDEHSL